MSVQFTRGPWTVILRGERGTFHIPQAQAHEADAAHADGVDGYSVSSANASLIAAAPDLYAALQALVIRCGRELVDPEDVHELTAARAALSRASGQKKGEA